MFVDGLQIRELSPRKGGGPGPPTQSPTLSITSGTSSPLSVSDTSSSGFISSSLPISTSSSQSPVSTSNTSAHLAEARHVGIIVGAVLGPSIFAALILMFLFNYRRRVREARKQPRGSVYLGSSPSLQAQMTQTHNGPPLTSIAPLVYQPAPIHFFGTSSSNTTPLSSLPSTTTSRNFPDTSTSSRRHLLSAPADPLSSPYDMRPSLSLDVPSLGPASSSPSGQISPLHRDMAEFQKRLESDHNRDVSDQKQCDSDSPPGYVG